MIQIIPTDDHDSLMELYARNELEISPEDPLSTEAVKSWILKDGDQVAGAATLAVREGEYILDGIAFEPEFRGAGLGTSLLKTVIYEVGQRGGERLFLVARAPGFFSENGFVVVNRDEAPMFFECFGCDQYGSRCFPEVMRYDLPKSEPADRQRI